MLVSGANAETADLQAISSRLTSHDDLHGRFIQTKDLSFLTTPIISAGRFSLSTAFGLDWLVETPLRSRMTVRDSTVMLDGEPVKDRGVGQFMAKIMQAFMTGDLQAVGEDFTVVAALSDDDSWRMTLSPRSLVVRSVISRIDLQGREFLDQISIVELDETRTLIEFDEVVGGPPPSREGHEPGA